MRQDSAFLSALLMVCPFQGCSREENRQDTCRRQALCVCLTSGLSSLSSVASRRFRWNLRHSARFRRQTLSFPSSRMYRKAISYIIETCKRAKKVCHFVKDWGF